MSDSVLQFYESLTDSYDLIFKDWDAAIVQQAQALDAIIRDRWQRETPPQTLYDCSSGIGTQALGLAQIGYRVHATDLSPAAVARARQEADRLNIDLTFGVADFRKLAAQVEGVFDVLISCDNSLPHLVTEDEMHLAASNIFEKLNPGGLLLVSIRDYDQVLVDRPRTTPIRLLEDDKGKRLVFQHWEWQPRSDIYTLHQFILSEDTLAQWQTKHDVTQYRAWKRDSLRSIFTANGFTQIQWHMPSEVAYYQPVMTAHRPG